MDDKQTKNTWDDLLQDLGAKPDESAFERHQAPAQEIPPTVECSGECSGEWSGEGSETEEVTAETQDSPGNWNSLAESLGLEVEKSPEPVEAEQASVKSSDIAETEAEVEESAAEQVVEEITDLGEQPFGGFTAPEESSWEEDTETNDDGLNDGTSDDDQEEYARLSEDELPPLPSSMDQALGETAWDDEGSEQESEDLQSERDENEGDENEGISGAAARSAFDALFSDGASSWGSAFLEKPKKEDPLRAAKKEPVDDLSDALLPESLEANEGEDQEETERPKRKRSRQRRRGGRGRKSTTRQAESDTNDEQTLDESSDQSKQNSTEEGSTEAPTENEEKRPRRSRSRRRPRPVEAGKSSESDDDMQDDDMQDDDLQGDDLQEDEAGTDPDRPRTKGRGRQLHRNLPTWSEAIGMIVDANLEQHAKSPNKPQASRGRGGRGGRGRGRRQSESK